MAEALCSEQELTCSICLDIFTDPVSTPCGHNFCQLCIGGYWDTSEVDKCCCPLCKRSFPRRPELNINRIFAQIAETYKESRAGEDDAWGGKRAQPGEIACDVCLGGRRRAVRSCLTCMASYCEAHIQQHLQGAPFSHHQLREPQVAFQGRMCTIHHKLLDVYCRTDQVCVCARCAQAEHRKHRTVSVQVERSSKQKLLGKMGLELRKGIELRGLKLSELQSTMESLRSLAQREKAQCEEVLAEVIRSAERIREELVAGINQKQEAMESRGEEMVRQLGNEMTELNNRHNTLEHLSTSEDHISFLQGFQEASRPIQTEDTSSLSLEMHFHLEEVKRALGDVRERLDDIRMGEVRPRRSGSLSHSESTMSLRGMRRSQWSLKDLTRIRPGSGIKRIRSYTDDITLNPVTAYPFLILSEDRKQVKRGEKLQHYRNSSQRYDVLSCVLGKEGFTSGRHYWEVAVSDNTDWKLGAVRESAPRKGLFDMSPLTGYWALWWCGSHLRALTSPAASKVKYSLKLKKVGVFVDYEEGQVSFYNAKTGSEIYTFTDSFSERLYPLLGTGDKEVPLVLCSLLTIAE
nr:PREDICTED: E3 ubiquitin-protein ligase TRIM11-like [Lepisosteus oculatus]